VDYRPSLPSPRPSHGRIHPPGRDREADRTAAVDLAVSRFGRLDVLVDDAGVLVGKGIEEISLDEWNRLVAVNMIGVFLGGKLAVPALREAAMTAPGACTVYDKISSGDI
jgi:NAD(P)-dependent dehydrogenase (short-subunit alcohol dehydrogenase family)